MRRTFLLLVSLVGLTVTVYAPVRHHEFIFYDDDAYVASNPVVSRGLTPEGVRWAFISIGYAANWHPLTWLSHMVDVQLFGLRAGAHHLVNVALHTASAALLFVLLRGLTGALWRSLLVAALFAVHPLHVESVAWVAERKDTLSTLFWMLTMLAYVRYIRTPSLRRYLVVAALLALGLMSKPMLVTLPVVLLLVDWWPLGRFSGSGRLGARSTWLLAGEKVPLFALAGISGAFTLAAQREGGVVLLGETSHLAARLAVSVLATATYLVKTVWPARLSVFYPFPMTLPPWWRLTACVAVLTGISASAFLMRKSRPWLGFGWAWYLLTLLPVAGIVKVGAQSMADRYSYVPLIGVFLVLAWAAGGNRHRMAMGTVAVCGVLALAVAARLQVGLWRDGVTLFRHSYAVTGAPWLGGMAEYNDGVRLSAQGRNEEAQAAYRRALQADPSSATAMNNLGALLLREGRLEAAAAILSRGVQQDPRHAGLRHNLGAALDRSGRTAEALDQFREAARLSPGDPKEHFSLGEIQAALGRWQEAADSFGRGIAISPDADAYEALGRVLLKLGRGEEAVRARGQAQRLRREEAAR